MAMTMDAPTSAAEAFLCDKIQPRPDGGFEEFERNPATISADLLPGLREVHAQHRAIEFGLRDSVLGSLCTMLAWETGEEQPPRTPHR